MYSDEQRDGMRALLHQLLQEAQDIDRDSAQIQWSDTTNRNWATGLTRNEANALALAVIEYDPDLLLIGPTQQSGTGEILGWEFTDDKGWRNLYE